MFGHGLYDPFVPAHFYDVKPVQRCNEFVNIGTSGADFDGIFPADVRCDPAFVAARLKQADDPGADNVEAEHLPVTDVEQDSAIVRVGPAYGAGKCEHCAKRTLAGTERQFQKITLLFAAGHLGAHLVADMRDAPNRDESPDGRRSLRRLWRRMKIKWQFVRQLPGDASQWQ